MICLEFEQFFQLAINHSRMSYRPRVYVGRLNPRAREYEVERFFQGYGKIRDIMLKNGFGFVEFDDSRDADDAIHDLNGKLLCGDRVVLEIAKGTPRGAGGAFVSGYNPPPSSARYYRESSSRSSSGRPGFGRPQNGYKLIIENLSSSYNWQDLKDLMDRCGDINYVDAHHYRRNEGVVEFARKKDMEYAIKKFDGKDIKGRKIKLIPESSRYSRSPTPEQRSRRSRSDSRGKRSSKRSRSRSRSRKASKEEEEETSSRKRYRSRSYSDSPVKKSAKDDASPNKSDHDASPAARRSRSRSSGRKSRSASGSPNGNGYHSRSRSASGDRRSRSKSASASP